MNLNEKITKATTHISQNEGLIFDVPTANYNRALWQPLQRYLEARGVSLPSEVFSALPYVMTLIVLVIVASGLGRGRLGAPAALGVPYARDGG